MIVPELVTPCAVMWRHVSLSAIMLRRYLKTAVHVKAFLTVLRAGQCSDREL